MKKKQHNGIEIDSETKWRTVFFVDMVGYSATASHSGQLKDIWDDIPFVYAGCIRHPEAIMQENSNSKAHPCQMPEKLAARPILFSTDPGELLLDPFCGSGTSCVAAAKLGRHYIGIDIEEKFCEMSRNRLADDLILRLNNDNKSYKAGG